MRWAWMSGRASDLTALAQYARLEAPARYFDGETAAPHPVVVSFGARSLVIMGYDGVALTHWPLSGLRAVSGRGETLAQFAPDNGSGERLVIDDREMVAAIEAVCPDLYRRPPERRRTGGALIWGAAAIAAVVVLVLAILPTLAGQLAAVIPPERERRMGEAVVGQIRGMLRAPGFCQEAAGVAALDRMTARLDAVVQAPHPLRVSVIDHPMRNAFAAPGGRILLFR